MVKKRFKVYCGDELVGSELRLQNAALLIVAIYNFYEDEKRAFTIKPTGTDLINEDGYSAL